MKIPSSPKTNSLLALLTCAGLGSGSAGTFSILAGGPTPLPGDELMFPGPFPLGIGGTPFEVNGISYGHFGVGSLALVGGFEFSVDAASVSAFPGSPIGLELATGETASADIYGAPFPPVGAHFGIWDADGAGPGPNGLGGAAPLGLGDFPPGDDVDGWDTRIPGLIPPIYFSLDFASAAAAGVAPGDILLAPPVPGYAAVGPGGIYAGMPAMGLVPGDDIDALVVLENDGVPGVFTPGVDFIMFSLAPGSPTLGGFGISAADILVDAGGAGPLGVPTVGGVGTPGMLVPAGGLDLAFADNLNALDIRVTIPEPGTFSLLGLSLGGLLLRRRRA